MVLNEYMKIFGYFCNFYVCFCCCAQ